MSNNKIIHITQSTDGTYKPTLNFKNTSKININTSKKHLFKVLIYFVPENKHIQNCELYNFYSTTEIMAIKNAIQQFHDEGYNTNSIKYITIHKQITYPIYG